MKVKTTSKKKKWTVSQVVNGLNERDKNGIYIKPYGHESVSWINTFHCVPYVNANGVIKWKVPFSEVTVEQIIDTFCESEHSDSNVIIKDINYAVFEDYDLYDIAKVFVNTLRYKWKNWFPKIQSTRRKIKILRQFIINTGVMPRDVVGAVFTNNHYTIQEFARIFNVTDNIAKDLLDCFGYEKKEPLYYYELREFKKSEIIDSIDQSEAIRTNEPEYNIFKRILLWRANKLSNRSYCLREKSDKIRYKFEPMAEVDNSEPVYIKRHDDVKLVVWFVLTQICVVFAFCLIDKTYGKSTSTSQYSALIAAIISGIISVTTTRWTLNRNLRIDFHQERLKVLPIINIKYIGEIIDDIDLDDSIRNILASKSCYQYVCVGDRMLIEYSNIGCGTAFKVFDNGDLAQSYDQISLETLTPDDKKYMVIEYYDELTCRMQFRDVYGNFYYQVIHGKIDYGFNQIQFNADPPEMVRRTNRIRYQQ